MEKRQSKDSSIQHLQSEVRVKHIREYGHCHCIELQNEVGLSISRGMFLVSLMLRVGIGIHGRFLLARSR
jgi:hypothetical protein